MNYTPIYFIKVIFFPVWYKHSYEKFLPLLSAVKGYCHFEVLDPYEQNDIQKCYFHISNVYLAKPLLKWKVIIKERSFINF